MKNIILIVLVLLVFVSCKSVKEQHLNTAYKLVQKLNNNESEYIQKEILLKEKTVGHNQELIENDCKIMKNIINKYGIPSISNFSYEVNENDLTNRYIINIVFHDGIDTLKYSKISHVSLKVFFGPLEYNPPNRINNYNLEIVSEGVINIDTTSNTFKVEKLLEDVEW
ncbi:MAG: hypothetical protein CVU05_05705 [Bacteroidetes bacterium HGW-Bacteroidetes-21]|nr:MAG: hypothetical protein CVU05_05705 [Bacteroidetes bacterium HGW-Bacteroidetes-21]